MFEGYSSFSSSISGNKPARRTRAGSSYYRKIRLAERSAEAIAVFTSSRPVQ